MTERRGTPAAGRRISIDFDDRRRQLKIWNAFSPMSEVWFPDYYCPKNNAYYQFHQLFACDDVEFNCREQTPDVSACEHVCATSFHMRTIFKSVAHGCTMCNTGISHSLTHIHIHAYRIYLRVIIINPMMFLEWHMSHTIKSCGYEQNILDKMQNILD